MTAPTPLRSELNAPPVDETPARVLPGHRMRVNMADGTEFVVRITNRDRVAWDKTAPKHRWGSAQEVPFLASTFLAWSAAKREGFTELRFEQFEAECDDLADIKPDEDDAARPTR